MDKLDLNNLDKLTNTDKLDWLIKTMHEIVDAFEGLESSLSSNPMLKALTGGLFK